MFKKLTFLLLAPALLALAGPTMTRTDKFIRIKGNSFSCNLLASKNYNFNFKDTTSDMSIFSALVWYHGRNEAQDIHFYKDHNSEGWPVTDIRENTIPNGKEIVLLSKNNEFALTRTIRVFNDLEALYLKFEVTALESRTYSKLNFPILRMVKAVDSVSWNVNGSKEEFATAPNPKSDAIAHSNLLFFHSSPLKRTLLIIPNLNAPLDNGEAAGLAPSFSDAKWCKSLSFKHLYLPFIHFMKAGDKQVFEGAMAVFEGDTLTDEMKSKALAMAERLKFTAPRFTMKGICENQFQPSDMAGTLFDDGKMTLWQEISGKRIHPETALPSQRLSEIRISTARNEAESVQLAINCPPGTLLDSIEASPLSCGKEVIPAANVELEFLEYQDVHNSYTTQGMSTQVGDKLLPLEFPCELKTKNQVIWMTITCPKGQRPGLYKGTLNVKWHGAHQGNATIPVTVKVWNFELPDIPAYTAYGLLWETPKEMRRATLEKASKYRHTTTVFYGGGTAFARKCKNGTFTDLSEFELAKYAVNDLHYKSINIPIFMGAWNWRPGKKVNFENLDMNSPEFEERVRGYLTAFHKQAKALGFGDRLNVYMWDEVTQPMYDAVARTFALNREISPELKVLTVGAPDEKVIENSDVIIAGDPSNWWGPIARERIEKGRAQGKEFWVYMNDVFVHYPLMYTRLLSWRGWGMGLNGFLYWTMDYRWKGNFSDHGLNWKFYPPVKKGVPVASVRLAVMRDGIDDYDYLSLAKSLPPSERALVEKISAPLTNPDTAPVLDPVALLKARESIGELLHSAAKH